MLVHLIMIFIYSLLIGQGDRNVKKCYMKFRIFMDLLKIQGFTESWSPKIFWDFLIFLYNVTNIQNKTEIFE